MQVVRCGTRTGSLLRSPYCSGAAAEAPLLFAASQVWRTEMPSGKLLLATLAFFAPAISSEHGQLAAMLFGHLWYSMVGVYV